MRLNPRDPLRALSTKYLGDAELGLGHFDAAIDDYHKAIDLGMQNNMWPYASLAAANALAGKMDDAKTALAEVHRLKPELTMKSLIPLAPPIPNLFDGLRGAGCRRNERDPENRRDPGPTSSGTAGLPGRTRTGTLSRLRGLRSDLIDPAIAAHHGRIVSRTGDGSIIEFRSVVDAVRCAIEVQNGLIERNAGLPPERRIEFRVGIHLGDVIEENDGDLMGEGVNIAARLEGIAKPGAVCLSEDAYRQVKGRLDLTVTDLGPTQLKNIAEPIRVYWLEVGVAWRGEARAIQASEKSAPPRLSMVVLPFANMSGDPEQEYFVDGVTESLTTDLSRIDSSFVIGRNTAFAYKGSTSI